MKIILKILITALAVILVAYLIPGIYVANFYTALWVAVGLGIINLILRPILFVLTLPITIITLGLFTFVINGLLFWFLSTIIKGFSISNFLSALVGAILVSLFSALGNHLLNSDHAREA